MPMQYTQTIIHEDPWESLCQVTEARIALGRAGTSLPLKASLAFKLDHARARDAVYMPFQHENLAEGLRAQRLTCLELESEAADRSEYLTRPDKGRRLSEKSKEQLNEIQPGYDVCFVLTEGLSARAIHEQGAHFVTKASELLHRAEYSLSPVCIVKNGRVALGDAIGHLLGARMVVVLIGERPGLSSPNSMGLYLTLNPAPGTTDESRNCISNIREGGLTQNQAIQKFAYLTEEALRLGCTGIGLKDRMASDHLPFGLSIADA